MFQIPQDIYTKLNLLLDNRDIPESLMKDYRIKINLQSNNFLWPSLKQYP